jgi:SAM-dependent methyltransferase
MRNSNQWQPTKYIFQRGRLIASRDPRRVGIASRIMASAVAKVYERQIPLYTSGSLLDLGCGRAPLFGVYSKYATAVTCVDWGESLHDNPYTDAMTDLNAALPFPDASFDTVLLSDVIEHVYLPHKLWGEMSRVLRPGGHILLNTPFYYCLHEQPHDYFRLTEFSLRRMALDSGLNIVTVESLGGVLSILGDITIRIAHRVPYTGWHLAALLHFVASFALKTSFGRQADTRTAAQFPFGYFMVSKKDLPQTS